MGAELHVSRVLAALLACLTGCSSVEREAGTSGTTTASSTSTSASSTSAASSTASTGGGGAAGGTSTGGAGGDAAGGAGPGGGGGQAGSGGATGGASAGGAGGGTSIDEDADGWSIADGDCCDSITVCAEPWDVNPGAMELLANGIDDDCDPATSDSVPTPDCGGLPLDVPTSALELVKAMDLCSFTSESPPLAQKKWGVISAQLLLADGSPNPGPDDPQRGVLSSYGPNVQPQKHATLAAISSGAARALGDPGFVCPQAGYDAGTQSGVPPVWLAAHGGALPVPSTCPQSCNAPDCTNAYDSIDLKLRIRVPTNAKSLSYRVKFYTAEYPEYLCQTPNDFFVALLTSVDPSTPADHNIAVDSAGDALGVNSGYLDICFPPPAAPPGTCPGGTSELVGTGMGGCGMNQVNDGGGTPWLTNEALVSPGETIEIELIVWDAGGHGTDSIALLDDFHFEPVALMGLHP